MSRDRPAIGVDLDGVVFSWSIGTRTVLYQHGVDIAIRDDKFWNEVESLIPAPWWHWVWNEGVREIFSALPVYPDVPAALRRLAQNYDIVVITHRPRIVADITLRRLGDLKIPAVAVHHVQGRAKEDVAPHCVAYIEDRPENVLSYAGRHDVPVFMPRRPYNKELHDGGDANFDIRPYDHFSEVTCCLLEVNL